MDAEGEVVVIAGAGAAAGSSRNGLMSLASATAEMTPVTTAIAVPITHRRVSGDFWSGDSGLDNGTTPIGASDGRNAGRRSP
nr:hypothetical protein Ade03nite_39950 [Actinoplanes derwentensis]